MEIKVWKLLEYVSAEELHWMHGLGCGVTVGEPMTAEINTGRVRHTIVVRAGEVSIKTYTQKVETMLLLKYGNRLILEERIYEGTIAVLS